MATKQGFYSRVHLYYDLTIFSFHFHCFQLPAYKGTQKSMLMPKFHYFLHPNKVEKGTLFNFYNGICGGPPRLANRDG